MKKNHIFLFPLFIFLVGSCILTKKQTYFQGEIKNVVTDSFNNPIKNYLLRPGDVLYIKIISTDDRLSSFFNVDRGSNTTLQGTPGSTYLQGYLVNDSGYVELPILGNIMAKGITMSEFRTIVTKEVNSMVSPATVIIKLTTVKIAVTGEVNSPGLLYFNNERVSIMEVLASAGDITLTGKRSSVEIIRQHLDGSYEKGTIDLNDINVIHSPWFYLQPNDMVYVPPTKTVAARFNINNVSLFFATVSTIILILTFVSYK